MGNALLNESLFFGLDHARSAIADGVEDFNTARPHASRGYQIPAAFAEVLNATGSRAMQTRSSALPLVANPAPYGVTETVETSISAG